MKISEAKKLKIGDIVYQKANGYKMTVQSIKEYKSFYKGTLINIECLTEDGGLMVHNHKEIEIKN